MLFEFCFSQRRQKRILRNVVHISEADILKFLGVALTGIVRERNLRRRGREYTEHAKQSQQRLSQCEHPRLPAHRLRITNDWGAGYQSYFTFELRGANRNLRICSAVKSRALKDLVGALFREDLMLSSSEQIL